MCLFCFTYAVHILTLVGVLKWREYFVTYANILIQVRPYVCVVCLFQCHGHNDDLVQLLPRLWLHTDLQIKWYQCESKLFSRILLLMFVKS